MTWHALALTFLAGVLVLEWDSRLLAQPQPAAESPAAENGDQSAPAAAADSETPADSQPQPATDSLRQKQMAIQKPLLDLEQDEKLRRELSLKIGKILRQGELTNEARELIDRWVEWRLYRMTVTEKPPAPEPKPVRVPRPEPMDPAAFPSPGAAAPVAPPPKPLEPLPYVRRLPEFNKRFLQQIKTAASQQNNAARAKAFRTYVLDQVIVKSRELLDNNFAVRLNVAVLLSQLHLVEPAPRDPNSGVVYAPISGPLLEIIHDPLQHNAVKVVAVVGLRGVLMRSAADRDLKNKIALELIAQLDQKASRSWWYPMRLVESLGRVDIPLITRVPPDGGAAEQKPFHVQTLVNVMRDQNRHWIVRAEAAKSLGRVSLHGTVNTTLIAHEIVVLSNQMAAAYNKNPQQFYWHQCFWNVYLAFKPATTYEETHFMQVTPGTLISKLNAQKAVGDAYRRILPVAIHVFKQPEVVGNQRVNRPIPEADMQGITAWINENKPSNNRLAPGLSPLESSEPMAARVDSALEPAALVRE